MAQAAREFIQKGVKSEKVGMLKKEESTIKRRDYTKRSLNFN